MFPARVTDSTEEWTNSSSLIWKQIKGYSESKWNQANRFSIHGKKKRKKEPYNRQGGEKTKNESYNRLGEIDH